MKKLVSIFAVVILILIFFSCFSGCKDPNKDDLNFPAENLSYGNHIQPLLQIRCAYSNCHDTETRSAGIDFQVFQSTTDFLDLRRPMWVFPLVTAGFPENSMLYLVIDDPNEVLNYMPPIESNYSPLKKEERDAIWKWIVEGANIHN